MAFSITSGRIPGAKKIVIYGPEGIGKSTLASQFPDPVFIDTEDSTKDMNVKRLDKPSSWQMLLDEVRFIRDNPTLCKTLVLDTADWAEQMEIDDLLKTNQKNGIEDFGYGKGYTYSAERFGKLLNLLTEVSERGVHIVMTAHAQLRKVELPEEMGAYDHWEMKTSKKVAPLIREWADAVLFLNYKVNVINIDNQGAAKGKNKAQGKFKAAMYGLFIVLLYTVPISVIILITYLVGGQSVTADIFNWLSTHWLPNLLFFVIFMLFAASFFGAFEIQLPSSLVNRSDKNSDKGGLAGVFFMALTLVLVSFSCTGPIVGTVLIKSTQGEFWTPMVTMLAFSIAFALPFTLLALFPSLLENLPKSGGWLNSVKVVLGFIELALGLKFLSTADQTYHWGILDREVYLALWIVIFTLLGFYLLGKLRFKYDSELKHISLGRLVLAIIDFAFVVYLIPGMWGAPLKALSGYLPPIETQDFVLGKYTPQAAFPASESTPQGATLDLAQGLKGYATLEEGLAAAKAQGKPVFVDTSGPMAYYRKREGSEGPRKGQFIYCPGALRRERAA